MSGSNAICISRWAHPIYLTCSPPRNQYFYTFNSVQSGTQGMLFILFYFFFEKKKKKILLAYWCPSVPLVLRSFLDLVIRHIYSTLFTLSSSLMTAFLFHVQQASGLFCLRLLPVLVSRYKANISLNIDPVIAQQDKQKKRRITNELSVDCLLYICATNPYFRQLYTHPQRKTLNLTKSCISGFEFQVSGHTTTPVPTRIPSISSPR